MLEMILQIRERGRRKEEFERGLKLTTHIFLPSRGVHSFDAIHLTSRSTPTIVSISLDSSIVPRARRQARAVVLLVFELFTLSLLRVDVPPSP
jgi:hypothetical protein